MVDSLKGFIDGLDSIRVQDESRLGTLTNIDSVAIVGSTCSGKSTIVDAIRCAVELRGLVDVPMRYITRPKRGKNNTVENTHLNGDEFQAKVDAGEIGLD